jgi:hypothetical protein
MYCKTRDLLLVLAMSTIAMGQANGADLSGKHAVRGAGLTKCQVFLDAYQQKGPEAHVFFGWIDGYISGLNELSPNTYDRVPWQSTELVAEVVRRACTATPSGFFFAELRAVIVAMDNERLAAGEEKKVLEMGEHRAVVYPDTLRRAQRALRVGGHYDGDINGKFDPATHSAIIKFQTAKGIPVSGLPGPITLWALLVEK